MAAEAGVDAGRGPGGLPNNTNHNRLRESFFEVVEEDAHVGDDA